MAFKARIRRRAKEKIAEQLKEEEEEEAMEKQARIDASPGGLDPIEVLESLPDELRRFVAHYSRVKLNSYRHLFIF